MRRRVEDIWMAGADGSGAHVLAQDPADDDNPVWSPDGERIAFESNREGGETTDIFVMFPDGTGLLRLTRDDADDEDPDWA
jgi:TolB protein